MQRSLIYMATACTTDYLSNSAIRYARANDNSGPGLGSQEVNEVARRVLRMNLEDAGSR